MYNIELVEVELCRQLRQADGGGYPQGEVVMVSHGGQQVRLAMSEHNNRSFHLHTQGSGT